MADDPYPDALLREVLEQSRVIAMVGASPRPERPSHDLMRYLQGQGYRVIPVNPAAAGQQILGERVYASLEEVPERIDMVDVFRRSEEAGAATDAAIAIGVRVVWMQLDVRDPAAAARAERAGLTVIMDRCPKLELARLGLEQRARGG